MEKIIVHNGERVIYPREEMDQYAVSVLDDLKDKLSEQEMVLSIFQGLTGMSNDIYRTVKDDYRVAYEAATAVKNKVSALVMDRYVAESGSLSWSFSAIDGNLTVYTA